MILFLHVELDISQSKSNKNEEEKDLLHQYKFNLMVLFHFLNIYKLWNLTTLQNNVLYDYTILRKKYAFDLQIRQTRKINLIFDYKLKKKNAKVNCIMLVN